MTSEYIYCLLTNIRVFPLFFVFSYDICWGLFTCYVQFWGEQSLLEIWVDAAWLDDSFKFAFSKLHPAEKYENW